MAAADHLPSSSRALVPLAPAAGDPPPHRVISRPSAFLAHLIAVARQAPQMRERRRAEPREVIAAYRATIEKLRSRAA